MWRAALVQAAREQRGGADVIGGVGSVTAGSLVEVCGFVDANGVYQATRIEAEDSASAYKIRGVLIDDRTARFEDGSAADLRVGARVEVKGSAPVAGVVTATEVEFDD